MPESFPKKITLCGIKHAGKTSVAKALAELTGLPTSDTDVLIQERYNKWTNSYLSLREVYQEMGETKFRQLEAMTVQQFSSNLGCIVSLGGGVLSNPFFTEECRKKLGFLCCLDVSDEIAYQRILQNGLPPFLADKPDPFSAFCEMNRTRRAVFREQADFILEIKDDKMLTPEEIAKIILTAYKENIQ